MSIFDSSSHYSILMIVLGFKSSDVLAVDSIVPSLGFSIYPQSEMTISAFGIPVSGSPNLFSHINNSLPLLTLPNTTFFPFK